MTSKNVLPLAKRCQLIAPSATLTMNTMAQNLKAQGLNILSMSAGEPDFPTPEAICEAAQQAIRRGETRYTAVTGTLALREIICQYAQKLYGVTYTPKEVIVSTGGKQTLFNAIACLINPGDEVIYGSPYWVSYPDMVRFFGGTSIPVWGDPHTGFIPSIDAYAQAITSKTKLLILNSPSNPSGATYSIEALQALAELLRQHPQIYVISDDIYSGLTYDKPFASLLHVANDLKSRFIISTGVSKTYAMTGWRIGFALAPAHLIQAMSDLQGASTSNACSIAQSAALAALRGDADADVEQMRQAFQKRRDLIVSEINQLPDVSLLAPKGAFYAFVGIDKHLCPKVPTPTALCDFLLEKVLLAVVPGEAFGSQGHIRLSFALSEKDIVEGVQRLAKGLRLLKQLPSKASS